MGGGSVKLVPHSGGYGVTGLDWSPSGGQLAFESRFDAVDAIGADGNHARRIASAAIEPRWSPDGTRLLSKSEDQLRLLILTTRNRRSMSLAVSADSAGWWDGSSVFYEPAASMSTPWQLARHGVSDRFPTSAMGPVAAAGLSICSLHPNGAVFLAWPTCG